MTLEHDLSRIALQEETLRFDADLSTAWVWQTVARPRQRVHLVSRSTLRCIHAGLLHSVARFDA